MRSSSARLAALLACGLAAPVALAAPPEPEVLLQTARFAGSLPGRAVADFWRDLTAAARADPELEAEGGLTLRGERVIRFHDTPESCLVRSHGYRLREEVRNGGRRWTLAGGVERSVDPARPPATLGDVARLFPELEEHRFDPGQEILAVNDLTLREQAYSGATLRLGGREAGLTLALWYTEPPTRPLTVLAALNPESSATEAAAFVEIFDRLVLWVEPGGGTRMDVVYRGFCR